VEATVKKIEQEILDGILKSDTAAIEKYVTSDYLGIGPDGATQNKSEFMSDVKSGTLKLESSEMSDIKIQVSDPDMAVVVYRTNDKGTYKGKDITGQYRWLDVFVKRDGKWQIAIDQGTPITKQYRLSSARRFIRAASTRARSRRGSAWYREPAGLQLSVRAELTTALSRRGSGHRHCRAVSSSPRCRLTPRASHRELFQRKALPCISHGGIPVLSHSAPRSSSRDAQTPPEIALPAW